MNDQDLVTVPRAQLEELQAEVAVLREATAAAPVDEWAARFALYRKRVHAREGGEEEA